MTHFTRIRRNPAFAHLFAAVHPLCWLILYWQIYRVVRFLKAHDLSGALFAVSRWGQMYLVMTGDRNPDPDAYTPPALIRPRWDDPAWAMDIPVFALGLQDALAPSDILDAAERGSGRVCAHRAPPSFAAALADTS